MLAWQTLAHDALRSGILVAPFAQRVDTGYGYYIVTSANRHEPKKVARFREWLKAEIAETAKVFAR